MTFVRRAPRPRARHTPSRLVALVLALALLLAFIPLPAPVGAATLVVANGNDAGAGSLRAALAAAEATPAADTITFAPGVTEVVLASGELAVTRDLTIQGIGLGGVAIRRSDAIGTPEFRILDLFGGASLTLVGLTIANGDAGQSDGGGIYAYAPSGTTATVTVRDSVLTGNTAFNGGAILGYANGAVGAATVTIAVIGSTLSGNSASGGIGGGILGYAYFPTATMTITVTDSTLSDNSTSGSGGDFGGSGGGIAAAAESGALTALTVTGSTLTGNTASERGGGISVSALDGGETTLTATDSTLGGNSAGTNGGGISVFASSGLSVPVTLSGTTVSENTARGSGGGIQYYVWVLENAPLTLTNSTVSRNTAAGGGGIYAAIIGDATLTLTNSTVSGNTASTSGGGLYLDTFVGGSMEATLAHATLADNTATDSQSHQLYLDDDASVAVTRSVLAHSGAGLAGTFVAGPGAFASGGYNVSGRDLPGAVATDLVNTDPLLAPLAANGGPTQTHALLLGSPAVDRSPADAGCPDTDQRGVPRPVGAACDSGAVEGNNTTTAAADASAIYGDAGVSLSATVTSPAGVVGSGSVTFIVKQGGATIGSPVVGSVANGQATATFPLTGVGAGAYIVEASYGDPVYQSSTAPTPATLTIARAAQAITFPAPPPATQGDPPFAVSASATSGLPVAFSAGPSGVCTIAGSTVTLVGAGACTIVAHQPGDANWLPAPDVARVVGVAACDGRFVDVAADDPACPAIAALVEAGVIKGYATTPPTFGPDDDVQRAQIAAFLVRVLGWEGRPTDPRTFSDFGALVAELRDAALILANACDDAGRCAAQGYGDGTFRPTAPVSHAQVVSFLARAFALDPAHGWSPAPPDCAPPYAGVPAVHAADACTYVANAGAIPAAPTTAEGWNAPASRAWVARVLWQALQAQP